MDGFEIDQIEVFVILPYLPLTLLRCLVNYHGRSMSTNPIGVAQTLAVYGSFLPAQGVETPLLGVETPLLPYMGSKLPFSLTWGGNKLPY